MDGICHRCHAALPFAAAGVRAGGDEERPLYCRECGAPQIRMPEYLRAEAEGAGAETTGLVPPPRPQVVDWPAAVVCAAPVAVVTAALAVCGLVVPIASFFNTVCVLCGSGMVLGLYRARRPLARIDWRVGVRVGLLTGLLMVAVMGIGFAATGILARYGVRHIAGFDAEVAGFFKMYRAQMMTQMQQQGQGTEMLDEMTSLFASPEVRAGFGLMALGGTGGMILAATTTCGALTGMLQTRRRALQSRE